MLSCIDRLPELHQRLSRVIVTNKDGIDLVKKYNTENTFLYLDPPYGKSSSLSKKIVNTLLENKVAEEYVVWKNYRCTVCGKLYTTSGNKLHKISHTYESPIKIICGGSHK